MSDLLASRTRFLISVFGAGSVNKYSLAVNCPECGKDKPFKKKLVIRIDSGMHHCWVCGLKGKTLKYTIRKYHPTKFDEYRSLFESEENSITSIEEEIPEVKIPKGFLLLAQHLKSRDPDIRDTISYARSRGITERDFWYFKLGACKVGRFRRRLIMPSFDALGSLNYFTARAIDSDKYMKYLNARAPKKYLIFNEINLDWNKEMTLVEGPMDLIKCNYNAVPLLGSSLNENYLLFQKLTKFYTPVLMALDPDASDKMHKICEKLYSYGVNIRLLDLDGYSDVGEMSKLEFVKRRQVAKAWSQNQRLVHMIKKIRSGSMV